MLTASGCGLHHRVLIETLQPSKQRTAKHSCFLSFLTEKFILGINQINKLYSISYFQQKNHIYVPGKNLPISNYKYLTN